MEDDSDPSNNYVPDEKSTSTENEMAVEEFSGTYKVSPSISQYNNIFQV